MPLTASFLYGVLAHAPGPTARTGRAIIFSNHLATAANVFHFTSLLTKTTQGKSWLPICSSIQGWLAAWFYMDLLISPIPGRVQAPLRELLSFMYLLGKLDKAE